MQARKKTSQAAIGKKGRKNCCVIGRIKKIINSVATVNLTRGPGSCIMHIEKIPTTANNRYCAS